MKIQQLVLFCVKNENNVVVEMTLLKNNTQIFASKYQTVLPSKEERNNELIKKKGREC